MTSEAKGTLVGGITGLEAYEKICTSIAEACGRQRRNHSHVDSNNSIDVPKDDKKQRSLLGRLKAKKLLQTIPTSLPLPLPLPLLRKDGIIIFQVPGGERGWRDVSYAIDKLKLGFKVVDVLIDERGVKRCLVLKIEDLNISAR